MRHSSISCLQISHHHQAAECLQRLVGVHIISRLTATNSLHPTRRCHGFCPTDLLCTEELVSYMDDKLFNRILSNEHHVLYQLLPPERSYGYSLRPRKHELCLTNKYRLDELNFIYRLLFKDIHWTVLNLILFCITFTIVCTYIAASYQLLINDYCYYYHRNFILACRYILIKKSNQIRFISGNMAHKTSRETVNIKKKTDRQT